MLIRKYKLSSAYGSGGQNSQLSDSMAGWARNISASKSSGFNHQSGAG